MNTNTVIILVVIFGIIIICFNCDSKEHYTQYRYPKYCKSCGEKSRGECNNCINCGYCLTPNGYGQCVTGDEQGPYFREDCKDYEYNNPIFSYFRSWFRPLWRRDKYYYDVIGYPKSTYKRYIRNHPRARRTHKIHRHNKKRHTRQRSHSIPKYRRQNRRKSDVYKN